MTASIREVWPKYIFNAQINLTFHHKSLDTGDEFVFRPETSDVPIRLAFADTLLRFLNSLPEAVVPASLHSRCVRAKDRDEAFEVLLLYSIMHKFTWW
jgi:hypothetical protein